MLALNVVIIFSALGSAVVLAYTRETVSTIPRIGFGSSLTAPDEEQTLEGVEIEPALNFLLVGVDSIGNLPPDHPLRFTRDLTTLTDTMIVLRVEPETGDAYAISIPRDLWVPIAEPVGYENKINGALALGGQVGRETLVTTIQDFLQIPIHRYLEVDFNGFLGLVREIGGLDVFIEYPLRDPKAQFLVEQTGCVTLTPDQALGYVRSRTLQGLIDGQWRVIDGRGDLGRIDRQQDFLVVALKQAFQAGLTNPSTLKGIIDNVVTQEYLTLDDVTTPNDLVDLAQEFSSFDADELNRLTLPVVLGTVGQASVVRLVEGEAQDELAIFRGETDTSRAFRIVIRNGNGEGGLAQQVQFALEVHGFRVQDTSNADNFLYEQTIIRHDPAQLDAAIELERWLAAGAVIEARADDDGRPVEIIVGADWDGVLNEPRALATPTTAPVPTPSDTTSEQVSGDPAPTAAPTPTPSPTPIPAATIRGCG